MGGRNPDDKDALGQPFCKPVDEQAALYLWQDTLERIEAPRRHVGVRPAFASKALSKVRRAIVLLKPTMSV